MKKKRSYMIVLVVIGIFIVVYFITCLIFSNFNFKVVFGKEERTLNYLDCTENVSEIVVNVASDNLIFNKSEDNAVHVKYYNSNLYQFDIAYDDGLLTINQKRLWYSIFNFNKKYIIEIAVPDTNIYSATLKLSSGNALIKDVNLDSIKIELSSGDVNIEDLKSNLLDINTSSGKIAVNNIIADRTNIKASSGAIDIKNLNSLELDTQSSSGSIRISNITVDKAQFRLSSGDLDLIDSSIKSLTINGSSGKIESSKLSLETCNIDTSSGNVILGVVTPDVSIYKMNLNTANGSISVSGGGYDITTKSSLITGNGTQLIKVNVSSGKLIINFEVL